MRGCVSHCSVRTERPQRWALKGYSRGTLGVLTGYSGGTHGYSGELRGCSRIPEGHSRGALRALSPGKRAHPSPPSGLRVLTGYSRVLWGAHGVSRVPSRGTLSRQKGAPFAALRAQVHLEAVLLALGHHARHHAHKLLARAVQQLRTTSQSMPPCSFSRDRVVSFPSPPAKRGGGVRRAACCRGRLCLHSDACLRRRRCDAGRHRAGRHRASYPGVDSTAATPRARSAPGRRRARSETPVVVALES